MIYLDTHVVIWIYAEKGERLSPESRRLVEESQSIAISPMVLLELDFLFEINRITSGSGPVYQYLHDRIQLQVCKKPFSDIVAAASELTWTRDPFDRVIVAQASLDGDILLTKDQTIRSHYKNAKW